MENKVRKFMARHGMAKDELLSEQNNDVVQRSLKVFSRSIWQMARNAEEWAGTVLRDTGDCRLLRAHLMMEELAETLMALANNNEVEVLDGLCDIIYVAYGAGITYGLPMEKGLEEVHRSNMTKPLKTNDLRLRDKEGYVPADLRKVIDENV